MIVSMLVLLQAVMAQPPSAVPEQEDDIVVMGRRLGRLRIDYRLDAGGQISACRVARSSGDPGIDRIGCGALRACAAGQPVVRGVLRSCVLRSRRELLTALAAARRDGR